MIAYIGVCLIAGGMIWIVDLLFGMLCHSIPLHILIFSFTVPFIVGISFWIWTRGVRKAIWYSVGALLAHYLLITAANDILYPQARSLEFSIVALKMLGLALLPEIPATLLGCFIASWARHHWVRTISGR